MERALNSAGQNASIPSKSAAVIALSGVTASNTCRQVCKKCLLAKEILSRCRVAGKVSRIDISQKIDMKEIKTHQLNILKASASCCREFLYKGLQCASVPDRDWGLSGGLCENTAR